MSDRQFHPVAEIFPLMEGEPFAQLVADIRENGLREDIWVDADGRIIDGRNRYRACPEAGVEPRFREWDGKGSLVAFVVSLNLHRRHMNDAQRGMVAAKVANLSKGNPAFHAKNANGSIEPFGTQEPSDVPVSNQEAADLLNVNKATVRRARQVVDRGVPELAKAVEKGVVSVTAAADVASLAPAQQRKVVAAGPAAVKAEASKIRSERREGNGRPTTNGQPKAVANISPEEENPDTAPAVRGVGVDRANEAINCLTRIPKNDALRSRGFQLVTDWIRHNK